MMTSQPQVPAYEFDNQLWIGTPDEKRDKTVIDSLYDCRIGGLPVWMYEQQGNNSNNTVVCPTCKSQNDLSLISQLFAPLFDLDRVLYIFLCRKCAKTHGKTNPEKSIVTYRCQNPGPDYFKKKSCDDNDEKEDAENKKKAEEEQTKEEKTNAFAADDDWGDDDDDNNNTNNDKNKAVVPPPNLAAENIEKKKKADQEEKLRKEKEQKEQAIADAKNKRKVQEVKSSIGGLNKCRCFNEYTLDIYDFDEDDDDDSSDDDDEGGKTNKKVSSAELEKQLDEIRKKFPNAEVDLETNPIVSKNDDDDMTDLLGDDINDDDDDQKKNSNSNKNKQTKKDQQAAKNELHMKQFDLFVKKISKQGSSQVIRWQPSGFPLLAAPLPISSSSSSNKQQTTIKNNTNTPQILGIPKCDCCGAPRMFEVQIVSPAIYFLTHVEKSTAAKSSCSKGSSSGGSGKSGTTAEDEEMLNFATILVFTCSNPYCDIENKYVRDYVIVQQEPVLEQEQAQLQKEKVQSGKK